ncbi:hypothetical protein MKW94_030714 [Papaver nudicaule]|uniref:Uncharacterized protein n=1 Tax=Papaver nudicaule TaxID=74823 RepID=A0AA41RZM8_PAPNU|nr:hypothetical protein [Papaver nudicaule]
MGLTNSKSKRSPALKLCKERKRFIKQAIESRYALSVSHLSYIESLKDMGVALRDFAETEEHDSTKTPLSNYSYPSPTQSVESMDSSLHSHSSYMRTSTSPAVTVKIDPLDDESDNFHTPLPPPPPPPHHTTNSSWDFFDGYDKLENAFDQEFGSLNRLRRFSLDNVSPMSEKKESNTFEKVDLKASSEISVEEKRSKFQRSGVKTFKNLCSQCESNGGLVMSNVNSPGEVRNFVLASDEPDEALVSKVEKKSSQGRGDHLRLTRGGKDFLSSIKDVENKFFRASECGIEVSRMLETNKVVSRISDGEGTSAASTFHVALHLACCYRQLGLTFQEPPKQMTKAITWNRSLSSRSSSSRNRLTSASKDDGDESRSDFIEEFSMITGSHSSTLDRLYAWEMKLYAEVKACERVKKKYDRKCVQLRHQFARDASAQMIDNTRAVIKDLYSQIGVGLHATDTIAQRIEKMRDEELKPQLVELIQGFIRMWKNMLECHHAQYTTISLAHHSKSSTSQTCEEQYRQALDDLQHTIGCFISSFAGWIDAHKSYVEAVNGWLQNCILQPRERLKRRWVFSPRRALAPPIFVLCRDWSTGIKALPSRGVVHAFEALFSILRKLENEQKKQEHKSNGDDRNYSKPSNLIVMHPNLTIALDQLTKFTEASLKMYEDVKQASEMAEIAYTNCKVPRY